MIDIKRYSGYINFIILLATVITGYIATEAHFAKADQVKKLELRLEQKIIMDRQDRVQERIWKIQDRVKQTPRDKEELRTLEKEQQNSQKTLDIINQKLIEGK